MSPTRFDEPFGRVLCTGDDGHIRDLHAIGEFDLANAGALTAGLLDALREQRDVHVDMSGVAFLDVVCLDELIAMRRLFADCGRLLALTALSPPVQRLLQVAGADTQLAGIAEVSV